LPKKELSPSIKDVIEAHIYSIIPELKSQKLSNLAIQETLTRNIFENVNIEEEESLREKIIDHLKDLDSTELKKALKNIEGLKKTKKEQQKEARNEKEKHLKKEKQR
jgi:hypothetical protein